MNGPMNAGDITQVAIVERWGWWQAAMKNPALVGSSSLPVHPGEYQLGYFRTKRKGGPWEPVGIYPDANGVVGGYRNNQSVDDIPELFSWACRYPVTHQAYVDAIEGKGWPDDDAIVAAQVAPPPPGDNSAAVDETEKLKDQIDAALKGVDAYAKISDDATSAKAQSLRNRLNELSGDADKKREALKRPHLDANTAIDKTYMPLVKDAKAGANKVKAAMDEWETEKLNKLREEQRRQAEELRKQEEAARATAPADEVPEVKTASSPMPAAAPAPIRPTYGRAASVSVKNVVTEVTDWNALSAYMINHPDFQACLRDLAQRAVDKGHTVPGVVVQEKAAVR